MKATPSITFNIIESPLTIAMETFSPLSGETERGTGLGRGRFGDELLRDKHTLSDRVHADSKIFIVQALSGG